ncbi:outer membrane protein [Neorhizobium sp. NCHU2750]|uniref:outer membrane protein n=1 Tax=Neorhizobium sp. NCHU2750 TaxID=1825976 RepID=UPI000E71574A|nr:outer membrane protein [Neorhizobium sp. NCHU2750]
MSTKLFTLAAAAGIVSVSALSASAADLANAYQPPAYNEPAPSTSDWTGAYAGIHAGTNSDHSNPFKNGAKFSGGIHGGYNTEINGVVVGGELELSHLGDTKVNVGNGKLAERQRVALKAKVGAPLGSTLIYGTAGAAMTNLRDSGGTEGPDGWKPGYVLGVGVEQKITGNLSGTLEYNYTHTADVRSFDGVDTHESSIGDHTIKAGVNYKF